MTQPPQATSAAADLSSFSLFDLFRSEAQSNAAIMNAGLLALERRPDDLSLIEPIMRGAHSIKGAARIVELDAVIQLAHAMEDRLVAAQSRRQALTQSALDALLCGVDLMTQIAALQEAQSQDWLRQADAVVRDIIARLSQEAAPIGVSAAAPTAAIPPISREQTGSPQPAQPSAFKVGAQNFDQILALASEARVVSHALQPMLTHLRNIKQGQRRWLSVLTELAQLPVGSTVDETLQIRLHDSLQHAGQLRHHFADQLDELERYERRLLGVSQNLLDEVLAVRMRPFHDGVQAFPRLVRDLARGLDKEVDLTIEGQDTLIDREVLGQLEGALNHILRNAIDHGIEAPAVRLAAGKPATGHIRMTARHVAGVLQIEITDDGQGVDPEAIRRAVVARQMTSTELAAKLTVTELLEFLLLPAFSLKSHTTELSGRGVGLDVVADAVRKLEGTVRLATFPGSGFRTCLLLPVTRSIVRSLVFDIGGDAYALPISHIESVLRLPVSQIHLLEGKQFFLHAGQRIGLVSARQLLGLGDAPDFSDNMAVLIIGSGTHCYGLVVEALRGEQSLAVKGLDDIFGKLRNISTAALLDDGAPVLILDVADLLLSVENLLGDGRLQQVTGNTRTDTHRAKRILVVEDSLTVREMERKLLQGSGFAVEVAVDGMDGWNAVRSAEFDLVVTDVDMPRLNGIELVELIRQDARLSKLPIMIVSYKDRPEDRIRGMEAGADYYLTKGSFHDDALLDAVRDLIGMP